VHALFAADDAAGADVALDVGGEFLSTSGPGGSYVARWAGCAVPPSPWEHLGFGLWNGSDQAPVLAGEGSLLPGSSGTVKLSLAKSFAPSLLFGSLASAPIPFKGGTLVPFPALLIRSFNTSPAGGRMFPFDDFPAGASGLELDLQIAIQDITAMQNVTLSNALRAHLP